MGFITEIKSLNEVPQFEVEKVQVFDGNKRCIDGVYSLQRSDTNQHLGMVKDKYRPIQMNEMIDIISEASDKVGDIDHIGYTTSKGGRKVVIQSKYRDTIDVAGDKVEPYIYTVIDNTGMGSNKMIPSTVRIACDNAFHLISQNEQASDRARHSASFDTHVGGMINNIVSAISTTKNFTEIVEKLKNEKFTADQMVQFTQQLIPVIKEESTRRGHKREKLVELYTSGRGNVGESRWDAFNAVTEYETHTGKQSAEKLIRQFSANTLSRQALNLLTIAG